MIENKVLMFYCFLLVNLKVLFVHFSWMWVEQLGFYGMTANAWAELNSETYPIA